MEIFPAPKQNLLFWRDVGVQQGKEGDELLSKGAICGRRQTPARGITLHKHNTAILGLSRVARAYEAVDDLSRCASATPTAARAADRPTSLSSPLAPQFLTVLALYSLAHTSDTTSTSHMNLYRFSEMI